MDIDKEMRDITNKLKEDWGDNGYCYFPYEWFTRRSDTYQYVFEAFCRDGL